ncbi:hypothetical protein Btru_037784 [Bulinus truncatus]|nr:hypothetical protein Btru_037784 [Bulinus truncatus]
MRPGDQGRAGKSLKNLLEIVTSGELSQRPYVPQGTKRKHDDDDDDDRDPLGFTKMASSYKKFYKAEEALNILDAIKPNVSDLDDDSTDDEEDILDFPNLAQDFNSTIDPTLSDNESEPDEQQPSTSSPPSTSKRKTYSWRKAIFLPACHSCQHYRK